MLVGIKVGFISKYIVSYSYYSVKSLKILNYIYKLGYIRGYSIISESRVKIYLKYINNTSVMRNVYLISKPSRKFYMKY